MSSNLDSASSTQPPPDPSNLPTAIATRVPPELLLDIFSIVGNSPSKRLARHLERNRNLKSLALVHSAWKVSAQQVLQEEVLITRAEKKMASDEEVERIASLLIDSKVQRTKYLFVNGHLNQLVAKTGYAMWSQVRYLKLSKSSRNDGTTRMSDFTPFPGLQELHLKSSHGKVNLLCFDPPDVNLRFPYLRRITFGYRITVGVLSQSGGFKTVRQEDLAALIPITHKLFSPSNMPNLRHLAIQDYGDGDHFETHMIILSKILPQITSLALRSDYGDAAIPENRIPDNLRHLSLASEGIEYMSLLDNGQFDLESLHLSHWDIYGDREIISRLSKIAKGEDPKNRIKRIVIYGKRKGIEVIYKDLVDDLDVFEWREASEYPPFEDFDGR